MGHPRRRGPTSLAPGKQGGQQPACRCAEASASTQASGALPRSGEPLSITRAALAQNIDSKCFSMRNGRSIVDQRLRRRALLGGLMASLGLFGFLAAVQIESVTCRDAAVYVVPPLCYFVMACITPAATADDINPAMEWCMRYASTLSAACAFWLWVKSTETHPCGGLVAIPGLLGFLSRVSVPLLGLRNPLWFWPAERCVLVFMGAMRLVQVAVQTHALLFADVASVLGLFELLPMPMAVQCQAQQS